MATPESIDALCKTREALKEIKKQLEPFLLELSVEDITENDDLVEGSSKKFSRSQKQENKKKAVTASMAVALAMGTLRYMGARLRGLDQGRKADDPLRKELNQMRKLMVTLQKRLDESKKQDKEPPKRKTTDEGEEEATAEAEPSRSTASKRRKT
mgnify:CR=1 FL=1